MSWFKKRTETKEEWHEVPDKCAELEKSIKEIKDDFVEREKRLKTEIEKLHRIIKFSSNESTFNLNRSYSYNWKTYNVSLEYENKLYIYHEKEEYVVELVEFKGDEVDKDSYEFRVDGDLAYFNVSSYSKYNGWMRREYIIDYKKESYVCNSRADEERNAKEREKEDSGRPVE